MNCEKCKEKLPLYILDELASNEISDVELHLKTCDECRKEQVQFKELINELTHVNETTISEDKSIHIKNVVYNSILQSAVQPRPYRNIMAYIVQTAAAIVIFLSGYFVSSYYAESFQPVNRYTINQNESELADSFKTYKNTKIGLKIIAKGRNAIESQ